jgi:hypothetical protein
MLLFFIFCMESIQQKYTQTALEVRKFWSCIRIKGTNTAFKLYFGGFVNYSFCNLALCLFLQKKSLAPLRTRPLFFSYLFLFY